MSNALAKHCSFALCVGNTLCIRYQLATFFTIRTQIVFYFFYGRTVRRLCVTGTSLGQRKHNEFRACALLVPNVRLALVWRSSRAEIHTWKNAHIFEHAENVRRGWRTQKMNDVHQAFSPNHQRTLTHAQRITTHWPKFSIFCALDVRDGMYNWVFNKENNYGIVEQINICDMKSILLCINKLKVLESLEALYINEARNLLTHKMNEK